LTDVNQRIKVKSRDLRRITVFGWQFGQSAKQYFGLNNFRLKSFAAQPCEDALMLACITEQIPFVSRRRITMDHVFEASKRT